MIVIKIINNIKKTKIKTVNRIILYVYYFKLKIYIIRKIFYTYINILHYNIFILLILFAILWPQIV